MNAFLLYLLNNSSPLLLLPLDYQSVLPKFSQIRQPIQLTIRSQQKKNSLLNAGEGEKKKVLLENGDQVVSA
jgi:hypothetical protein